MADHGDQAKNFSEIVQTRRSVRAFLPDAVPTQVIEEVFTAAIQSPSNCNTQPWFAHIVTGDLLESLREELPKRFAAGDASPDFPYEGKYDGVYRDRQYASARALYTALGIPREEKARRQSWFMNNFSFFGAPAVCFFTLPAQFGLREACDLGMFAQTVMLGLTAHGLGSCPQAALSFLANVIRPALNLPDDQKLVFGLSFGYPDTSDAVNTVRTDRAELGDVVTFHN